MKRITMHVVMLLMLSCIAMSAVAQEEADRLGMIRAVNRNSFQAISSIHAKYTTITIRQGQKKGDPSTRVQLWNEWWQDGKQVRWITEREVPEDQQLKRRSDTLKRVRRIREEGVLDANGDVKSVRKQSFGDGKWVNDGAIAHHKRDQPLGADLWIIAMFVIRQQPRATLADLLDDPRHVKQLGFEIIENRQCEKLLLQPPATPGRTRYEYEVVVDSRYNYLVRRLTPISSSSKVVLTQDRKVHKFLECAPGLFFPAEIESHKYSETSGNKRGQLVTKSTTRFTYVKANQPIDHRVFDLKFEAGTPIYDQRNQTSYIIGKDQLPIGPVTAVPVGGEKESLPTYEEPTSGWGSSSAHHFGTRTSFASWCMVADTTC